MSISLIAALVLAGEMSLSLEGAEIPAFDATTQQLYVTSESGLQVVDLRDPSKAKVLRSIDFTKPPFSFSNDISSVAVKNGLVAVVAASKNRHEPGRMFLLDSRQELTAEALVGVQPDMVTFTHDGSRILVANEGEPSRPDGKIDPPGSVSIVDIRDPRKPQVQTVGFESFDAESAKLAAAGVRIFPGRLPSTDFEPEYIAVSQDNRKAMVTLQEANAIAVLNIADARFERIVPLGLKDWRNFSFDGSSKDGGYVPRTGLPIYGMYMPDAIAGYVAADGRQYYVIANEGDDRDDFVSGGETGKLESVVLDPKVFANAKELQKQSVLGSLAVPVIKGLNGDTDNDGKVDVIHTYGGRSFSILDENGNMVYESGDHIERTLGGMGLWKKDAIHRKGIDEGRSPKKGPEPEGVAIGSLDGKTYAFITIERGSGGVMAYDVGNPTSPEYAGYWTRIGDLAPEGVLFVPASDSASGKNLLILANEKSGSLSIFSVGKGK